MRAARTAAARTGLLAALARSERTFLRHLRTMFAVYDAEDLAALDLPWWSYRAIRAVERFLDARPQARVFEFGSGASTVWLARRAGTVDAVEHDLDFVEVVRGLVAGHSNVSLHAVPAPPADSGRPAVRSQRKGSEGLDFSAYVDTIDRVGGPFDLIVVDGRARLECLRRAVPHVADEGLILFDDVHRARYRAALAMPGLAVRVLRGGTPSLPYPTATALLRPMPR